MADEFGCSSTLLPLLSECRALLDPLLDMGDGTRDGKAGQLDTLQAQCLAIPVPDVLSKLGAENCSAAMLNDVGRTEVGSGPCVDTRDNCDGLVAAGMQCKDATMISDCRATCSLCDKHRRAQITTSCALKTFDEEAAAVNAACCDDAGCTGVPTACDAKCAVVFDSFFERCSSILGLQIPADQMAQYTGLYTTCSQQLPIQPLLTALFACQGESASSPSPPAGGSGASGGRWELRSTDSYCQNTPAREYQAGSVDSMTTAAECMAAVAQAVEDGQCHRASILNQAHTPPVGACEYEAFD
jgi:hypothetical protein